MPRSIVAIQPIGSRPGTSRRAMAPANRPKIIQPRMLTNIRDSILDKCVKRQDMGSPGGAPRTRQEVRICYAHFMPLLANEVVVRQVRADSLLVPTGYFCRLAFLFFTVRDFAGVFFVAALAAAFFLPYYAWIGMRADDK